MITLGIIGVVAAMTLPSIVNNARNKQLEASLKKNYSIISQALELYQARNGERLTPDVVGTLQFKKTIMPYFKIVTDCGMGYNDSKACIPVYDRWFNGDPTVKADMIKDFAGKKLNFENGTGYFDDGQFVLLDGSLILLENFTNASRLYISVDVNGFNKGPNRLGHDIFTTQITKNGKLLPMGAEGTDFPAERYCSISAEASPNGIGCTYRALTEKDYFKNLP